MKKILFLLILSLSATCFGQQFPFMEGYNINPFNLSPAFAGTYNLKTVFVDYRSDWLGLDGSPRTYMLSYNDKIGKVGLGGRYIYDKTDIFKQTLLLGTYSYQINITKEQILNFALSAGFFKNSIDLSKYFNDPSYVEDQALIYGQQKSKIKFASDISALYKSNLAEAGVLFSNVLFGRVRYSVSDMTYKPFKNYLLHASYLFVIDKQWDIKPTIIVRGGEHVPAMFEVTPTVTWNKCIWGNLMLRSGGIFGVGLGTEISKGIILNYSYNLSSRVALNSFGSHQITLGVRLFRPKK